MHPKSALFTRLASMPFSPFLEIKHSEWILSNELAFAVLDRFPVNPGHILVITKRLVATWFEASPSEQAAVMALVNEVKQYLDQNLQPKPSGYNVGFNSGSSAGQTVMHLHVHVIPRYDGDMADPRGGVRHVIPEKGNYLSTSELRASAASSKVSSLQLVTGHPNSKLWDHLSNRLIGAKLVDVLASFVQPSGLQVIEARLFEAVRNQATLRILISDYLYISDPRALRRLLGWQDWIKQDSDCCGSLSVRLVQCDQLVSKPESFHPKAWRIVDQLGAFVAVGSSNLSRPALETGVEWNLLYSSHEHSGIPNDFEREFNSLWQMSADLTQEIVAQYEEQAAKYRKSQFEPESQDIPFIPEPRPWQRAALESLIRLRESGYSRALVAVATGMGKTWLAAFDACQVGKGLDRRPRILIIAHRAQILAQAESALSLLLDKTFGDGKSSWYLGDRSDLSGELVIASIQKLARPEGLTRIASERFDYVVIDEVHHAEAPSYRRVMLHLNCGFILGLTATPERTDGVDVASIFDDNLAHHASIGDGIHEESLVPFHYIGVKDTVDFRQVPWRNGRFEIEELEKRVEDSQRMQRLLKAMHEHPAQRSIVFCVSRRHAIFTRNWLRNNLITAAAVFSGTESDSCGQSLEDLRTGAIQALCVVDMFNEGLDIPTVDRVIFLRPTESKVIFLQQLGRGLRAAEGKSRLLVIDFVGNHRIFAQRILHLLSLTGKDANWNNLKRVLEGQAPELPPGCLLDIELAARDMLKQFIPSGSNAGIEAYRALRDELGRRPSPSELFARGYLPNVVCQTDGSWFDFVDKNGDLSSTEKNVLKQFGRWLKTVQTTSLNKSYKMIVLRVLLDQQQLFGHVQLSEFSKHCRSTLMRHPVLQADLREGKHELDHQNASDEQWAKWWTKWPIDRWIDQQSGHRWFRRSGERFESLIECPPELQESLEAMTAELVDWRLAAYAKSRGLIDSTIEGNLTFEGKVSHASGRPILFLPSTAEAPERPIGPAEVVLPDGSKWEFKFVKVACNVGRPMGSNKNQLAELLRGWFGPNAGVPGTDFRVKFWKSGDQWHIAPSNLPSVPTSNTPATESIKQTQQPEIAATVKETAKYKTHVPVYDLVAAAGSWGEEGVPEPVGWAPIRDKQLTRGMFVAQVVGQSMEPKIPSGSWCLFKPLAGGSRQNKLVLVQLNTHIDPIDGGRYTVKQYHSTKTSAEDGWHHDTIELQSLNPDYEPILLDPENASDVRIIGEFVAVVS
jgi:superfamily II DNA or RNA helicase/diadenosine tetraphosphate (Ap4A) HIT family hydrolase/phage repressor protein C with HTH and peptisase S24 domain